jgi:hypothetical protein
MSSEFCPNGTQNNLGQFVKEVVHVFIEESICVFDAGDICGLFGAVIILLQCAGDLIRRHHLDTVGGGHFLGWIDRFVLHWLIFTGIQLKRPTWTNG